ncbi:MAG TPA: tripartite tricarboxylate transporter substrate binding protein [Burkholderiaceae bacterium]|nr:tripartite tricarboxylate transporter substrate binding protein [Burkholderiaceae bacterium]
MNLLRRTFSLAPLVLLITTAPTFAQQFPSKPLRWVVPSTPGDGSDITGRLVGERVAREIGQQVVIDNKPGAGGVLGSEATLAAPADGYTMIVGNAGSHGINAAIYTKLKYDVARDFVPVALICTAPNVMVASPGTPAKSIAEFVAYAKANPGKLNYASGGIGSSAHMSAELLKSMAGIEMTHVPYKGSAPAVNAVLANEVNVMIGNLPPWTGHLKAGKVQALAVTTARRHPDLPAVPTMAEAFPGFETVAWFGLLAPAGTPQAAIERVHAAVNAALADPEVASRIAATGCTPAPMTQQAFADRVRGDIARWKKLAAERNIRAD